MQVEIVINAIPVPEPRKRVAVVNGRAKVYTPRAAKVNTFKHAAKLAAKCSMKRMSPLTGPLCVELTFVMPRTLNQVWKTKPMPRMVHDKKPDLDNLQKSTWDALNGIVWQDDSQICEVRASKLVADGSEEPRVVVVVHEVQS